MNLSRVVVIVAVTAALVYFGLNMLLPQGKGASKTETATTADEVFAAAPATEGSSAETASGDAAAPAEAPTETPVETTSETPAEAPVETATEVPGTAAEGTDASTTSSLTDEQARQIAADVAERVVSGETIPEAAAPAGATSATAEPDGLTADEARRIAENVSREVAARVESGGSVPTETAAIPDSAPAPAPTEYSAPAETAPVAAAEPAPKPKPSRSSTPAKTTVASSGRSSTARTQTRKSPVITKVVPGSDSVSSWWRGPGEQSAGRLNLVYAGEAAAEKAVVLLFDNVIGDAAAAGSQIRLLDVRGTAPSGSWELGSNPRMIMFKGVAPGRYTVIVNRALADASGRTMGSNLFGPVYVH